MKIERDFTSGNVTLSFESTGMRINLTKEETEEFDKRINEVRGLPSSILEALNSGDGSYHP